MSPQIHSSSPEKRAWISPTRIFSLKTLFVLLPSYIQILISPSRARQQLIDEGISPRKFHKTTWLDGLRGVSALIVVVYHWFIVQPINPLRAYYAGPYSKGIDPLLFTNPIQLPFFRLLYAGELMVSIFFLISGYVLSFRQVRLINSSDPDSRRSLLDLLSSSIIRRGFRLFLPTAAIVVIVTIGGLLHLHDIYKVPLSIYSPFIHILRQIWLIISLTWKIDLFTDRLQQFWTISAEFSCSMILFIFTIGVSGMTFPFRIGTAIIFIVMSLMNIHWGVACFLAGWIIAEFEYLEESTTKIQKRGLLYWTFWSSLLALGGLLGSYPSADASLSPFIRGLLRITPKVYIDSGSLLPGRFWTAIAATMIVWSLFRLPFLQRIFTTRIALYLGDVSFSLYLVHYQLVLIEKVPLKKHSDTIFGRERPSHMIRISAWTYELLIVLFLSFWQADLCWRYIDAPSVRFSKWLEKKVRKGRESDGVTLLPTVTT